MVFGFTLIFLKQLYYRIIAPKKGCLFRDSNSVYIYVYASKLEVYILVDSDCKVDFVQLIRHKLPYMPTVTN